MKKIIALLLTAVLLLSLNACAGGAVGTALQNAILKPDSTADTKPADTKPADTKPADTKPADTKPADTEPVGTEPPATEPPATEPPATGTPEPSAEGDLTMFENDDCAFIITGFDPDNFWGPTVKVRLENKTADKNMTFSVSSACVNGVAWNPFFLATVGPGLTGVEDISFLDSTLQELIPEFTDVEMTVRVYDADTWTDEYALESFHYYPMGEDKATTFVRKAQPTDTVIVDTDQISISVIAYDPENFWGYAAHFYLENKTDTALTFSADNVAINGVMCDPYWAVTVPAERVTVSVMSWLDSSLKEHEITEIEEIQMELTVNNAEEFTNLFDETVTLKP